MQDEVSREALRWGSVLAWPGAGLMGAALLLATFMAAASALGLLLRWSREAPQRGAKIVLEEIVPRQFGSWREQTLGVIEVINPQTRQVINHLYSGTLARIYENTQGRRVMLSLAYGGDQRGELRAHKPEVCYPAQGFELHGNEPVSLSTPWGSIKARRLLTRQGLRQEPVTYWFTMGQQSVGSTVEQRWVELKLAMTGQVPDGLLFRVSSLDADPINAFGLQDTFILDLLTAVPPVTRLRLAGLGF
ncbi:MAG: exosortase-associated protein EpsI, B-type [Burkholderiales bacterium]